MTMPEDRRALPGFVVNALDRCDAVRGDPVALAECFADRAARRVLLQGLDPVIDGDRLAREPLPSGAEVAAYAFLGKDDAGTPLFVGLRRDVPHGGQRSPAVWEAATILAPEEMGLLAAARSLVDWHARHGFCAACGGPTAPDKGGWARQCDVCGAHHFPRVDPVVIMAAEHDGRVLLGRQPAFPPGRYSALAGFVEPGETVEGAVARELMEEAGIAVHSIRYVGSQPWPFPSSLMLACLAQARDDRLTIDRNELEDARWMSADEVRRALERAADAPFDAPPPMAVAHHLLRRWLAEQG